jgi:hypothetical protein
MQRNVFCTKNSPLNGVAPSLGKKKVVKMALANMKSKPYVLAAIILLLVMSISMFGFALSGAVFNLAKSDMDFYYDNDIDVLKIKGT